MTAEGANPLVVCCDPVDGSSNLDVNGSVGTIFSLRPSRGQVPAGPAALGPGTDQVAAGYVMYGPATTLVYTVGAGHARVHARARGRRVPPDPPGHQDQAPRKDLRHQRGQFPHVAPGAARLRRVLAHARQGKRPPLFTSLLRRHGGRRPPNPARRGRVHVSRRLHRSRQAQAEAPAPLRGRADGHARRAGGRAREHGDAAGAWTCRPPSIISARRSSSAAPTTWRRPRTSTGDRPDLGLPAKKGRHHGDTGEGDPELVRERKPRGPDEPGANAEHGKLAGTGKMVILPVDRGLRAWPGVQVCTESAGIRP